MNPIKIDCQANYQVHFSGTISVTGFNENKPVRFDFLMIHTPNHDTLTIDPKVRLQEMISFVQLHTTLLYQVDATPGRIYQYNPALIANLYQIMRSETILRAGFWILNEFTIIPSSAFTTEFNYFERTSCNEVSFNNNARSLTVCCNSQCVSCNTGTSGGTCTWTSYGITCTDGSNTAIWNCFADGTTSGSSTGSGGCD